MQTVLARIPYWGFWALLVYMPFHIFLSQWLSLYTGGLEVWKVGKDVGLAGITLFAVGLVYWQRKASNLFNWLLGLSVLYGLLHLLLWTANPDINTESALLGFAYNTRLPAFLLLGMAAALLNPGRFVFSLVFKIMLGVSTTVATLGVIQYFLPPDILTHLGYSLERGVRASFFIDDHPELPRIMSTLREPNALGAYLILPAAALTALLSRARKPRNVRLMLAGALILHLLAIFLTFSRSAWIATALALGLVIWWGNRQKIKAVVKRFWILLAALLVITSGSAFLLRDTAFFQGYIIHTTELATGEYSSTELHYMLAREGAEAVVERPAGYGPGTAGLVSIQDPAGGQLTENYYIQIAYEIGVAGLVLFVAINVLAYRALWRRRDTFGFVLLAVFWGYVFTNLLLHTWTNEAVAAQWWLLAGVVAVSDTAGTKTNRSRR